MSDMIRILNARFYLGQVVATPGALDAIAEAGQNPLEFLSRHSVGDWGEMDTEDKQANQEALQTGSRLMSAYRTAKDIRIWVITEWDRSVTTILLPMDY